MPGHLDLINLRPSGSEMLVTAFEMLMHSLFPISTGRGFAHTEQCLSCLKLPPQHSYLPYCSKVLPLRSACKHVSALSAFVRSKLRPVFHKDTIITHHTANKSYQRKWYWSTSVKNPNPIAGRLGQQRSGAERMGGGAASADSSAPLAAQDGRAPARPCVLRPRHP